MIHQYSMFFIIEHILCELIGAILGTITSPGFIFPVLLFYKYWKSVSKTTRLIVGTIIGLILHTIILSLLRL